MFLYLKNHIKASSPLIGIEPSAILSFKDEYLRLANDKDGAKSIAKFTYTIEEFIANEFNEGRIKSNFSLRTQNVLKFMAIVITKLLEILMP